MIIPSDINDIQPRSTYVWNCHEVGFDPNGGWHKVICTYKFFQGGRMWKVQTGERAPCWCTLLVFTQADGQYFMPSIIVHQAKEYSKDIHFNIPLEWTVHHTPYRYMDRGRWIKSMTQFSNTCGASPVNNQILFFGRNGSHYDKCKLRQIRCRKIQSFVLKSGNSIND